ncbi:MAG: hypothetical protein J5994_07305 [Ruminococcus sp.]|nr:hypothetical protein [Ruminococcus sp.]
MSKDAKNKISNDSPNLINQDDYEYEKLLADKERERIKEYEKKQAEAENEQKRRIRQAEKEREKQIAKEKLELLQLKNGVINEDDATIREEHQEAVKLTGKAWLSNFWYHYKYVIIFSLLTAAVVIFLFYSEITRERPDLTVMMIADNGLSQRQTELEEFFEKYTDDLDGNGYVHVAVINIPMSPNNDYQTADAYSSKFFAQLQTGEGMIVITDSNTKDDYKSLMDSTLEERFPGNKYIDDLGFSFNSRLMADELKYEYMPNDVHMSIRYPVKTMDLSKEESQENYDKSFKVFKRIVDDVTQRCEESNDPGLENEPIKYDTEIQADSESSYSK